MNYQNFKINNTFPDNIKIIAILGPTATGKSELAFELAQQLKTNKATSTEIINADSIQIFQKLNIGAAKPPEEYFTQIPHHLYNFLPLNNSYTAFNYRSDVLKIIEKRKKYTSVFLLVGGSGFYIRALEHDMYKIPFQNENIANKIKEELKSGNNKKLYQELNNLDPEYAKKISSNDSYRIERALTIIKSNNKKISEIKKEFENTKKIFPYHLIKIGLYLPREQLREKIQIRTEKMIENGLIEEVQNLLTQGFEQTKALNCIGYKEVVKYLKNQISKEELIPLIVQNTSQLAKKQMTWFKKDKEITWFHAEKDLKKVKGEIYCKV